LVVAEVFDVEVDASAFDVGQDFVLVLEVHSQPAHCLDVPRVQSNHCGVLAAGDLHDVQWHDVLLEFGDGGIQLFVAPPAEFVCSSGVQDGPAVDGDQVPDVGVVQKLLLVFQVVRSQVQVPHVLYAVIRLLEFVLLLGCHLHALRLLENHREHQVAGVFVLAYSQHSPA